MYSAGFPPKKAPNHTKLVEFPPYKAMNAGEQKKPFQVYMQNEKNHYNRELL